MRSEIGKVIVGQNTVIEATLIAFHSSARRLTEFTNNQRILREALDQLETSDVPSQIEEALRMAQALSRTVSIDTVLLLSDGNIPVEVNFELPFQLNYQQLPSAGANLGITAFNARRSGAESWDVFVRIEASKPSSGSTAPLSGEALRASRALNCIPMNRERERRSSMIWQSRISRPTSLRKPR